MVVTHRFQGVQLKEGPMVVTHRFQGGGQSRGRLLKEGPTVAIHLFLTGSLRPVTFTTSIKPQDLFWVKTSSIVL